MLILKRDVCFRKGNWKAKKDFLPGLQFYFRQPVRPLKNDKGADQRFPEIPFDIFLMHILPRCSIRTKLMIGATCSEFYKFVKRTMAEQDKLLVSSFRKRYSYTIKLRNCLIRRFDEEISFMLSDVACQFIDAERKFLTEYDTWDGTASCKNPCDTCGLCSCEACASHQTDLSTSLPAEKCVNCEQYHISSPLCECQRCGLEAELDGTVPSYLLEPPGRWMPDLSTKFEVGSCEVAIRLQMTV
ncbi:hypothetical protein DFS34DRAFT_6017 [Phlyctochytrium arcticum]|nr:hypothetical protein DFS34DRAFT_6017 [Phlyctochytrium arcticum]